MSLPLNPRIREDGIQSIYEEAIKREHDIEEY